MYTRVPRGLITPSRNSTNPGIARARATIAMMRPSVSILVNGFCRGSHPSGLARLAEKGVLSALSRVQQE